MKMNKRHQIQHCCVKPLQFSVDPISHFHFNLGQQLNFAGNEIKLFCFKDAPSSRSLFGGHFELCFHVISRNLRESKGRLHTSFPYCKQS